MSKDQKFAIGLFIFSSLYLFHAYQIPSYPFPVPIDSDVFPTLLGTLLFILSLLLFWQGKRTKQADSVQTEETAQPITETINKEEKTFWARPRTQFWVILVAMMLYAGLIEILGFVVVTMVFLFGVSRYLGYRRHLINGMVAIIFSLGMFYIFTQGLQMNLPKGVLSWIL